MKRATGSSSRHSGGGDVIGRRCLESRPNSGKWKEGNRGAVYGRDCGTPHSGQAPRPPRCENPSFILEGDEPSQRGVSPIFLVAKARPRVIILHN